MRRERLAESGCCVPHRASPYRVIRIIIVNRLHRFSRHIIHRLRLQLLLRLSLRPRQQGLHQSAGKESLSTGNRPPRHHPW